MKNTSDTQQRIIAKLNSIQINGTGFTDYLDNVSSMMGAAFVMLDSSAPSADFYSSVILKEANRKLSDVITYLLGDGFEEHGLQVVDQEAAR